MNRPFLPMLVVAFWALLPGTARASDAQLPSRLFLGSTVHGDTTKLEIDGTEAAEEHGGSGFGVAGGYGHTVAVPWFRLFGVVRFHEWDSDWSNRAGEERWRLDLAVGPQVYLPINRIPRWLNGYFLRHCREVEAWPGSAPGPILPSRIITILGTASISVGRLGLSAAPSGSASWLATSRCRISFTQSTLRTEPRWPTTPR